MRLADPFQSVLASRALSNLPHLFFFFLFFFTLPFAAPQSGN
jgi:hypothetical protein